MTQAAGKINSPSHGGKQQESDSGKSQKNSQVHKHTGKGEKYLPLISHGCSDVRY